MRFWNKLITIKEEFNIFFMGVSDALKYDIIWTENGNEIDCFVPELLTLKELGKYESTNGLTFATL